MANALSRRERQIMDIIYRLGQASAEEIRAHLTDAPHNASVRTILGILVKKGQLRRQREKRRYLYTPVVRKDQAGTSALKNVVQTFFQGSPQKTLTALLSMSRDELSAEELDELRALIEARGEKKGDGE